MTLATPTLGWLGTGRMGTALANRLLAAGHDLAVWNRTRDKTAPLQGRGALAVRRIADLAACEVVFVSVAGSPELEEVVTGPGGLLARPGRPQVIVDCSTVSAAASAAVRRAANDAGVAFVAAPVSGNPRVVEAGGASVVASGPIEAFRRVEPLLAQIAGNVVHAGQAEESRLVKLCHNLYLGMMVQALVEVTTLAEKGGTDPAAFLEFFNGTVLSSGWTRERSADLVDRDWTSTFTMRLLDKDFDLGLNAAAALEVPMPVASAVHGLVTAAIRMGFAEADLLSLYAQQAEGASLPASADDRV